MKYIIFLIPTLLYSQSFESVLYNTYQGLNDIRDLDNSSLYIEISNINEISSHIFTNRFYGLFNNSTRVARDWLQYPYSGLANSLQLGDIRFKLSSEEDYWSFDYGNVGAKYSLSLSGSTNSMYRVGSIYACMYNIWGERFSRDVHLYIDVLGSGFSQLTIELHRKVRTYSYKIKSDSQFANANTRLKYSINTYFGSLNFVGSEQLGEVTEYDPGFNIDEYGDYGEGPYMIGFDVKSNRFHNPNYTNALSAWLKHRYPRATEGLGVTDIGGQIRAHAIASSLSIASSQSDHVDISPRGSDPFEPIYPIF